MAAPDVDTSTLVEMSVLIEQLTTSGKSALDEKTLKQLKKICRMSDGYVKQAYRLTLTQLEKDHAEIRLSAVQLVNELFLRSHCFREMLLAEFQHFMELTLETDLEKPLPLPVRMAKELKKQSIKFIQDWFTKFGNAYKQLALGYNFLINCKKVNFVNIQAQTVAEERLAEERRTKHELRLRTRACTALEEMQGTSAEIRLCLTEAESCMSLLIPNPDAFDIFDCSSNNDAFKTKTEITIEPNQETGVHTDRVADDDDDANTPGEDDDDNRPDERDLVNSDETVVLNHSEKNVDSQICNICPPVHGQTSKDNGCRSCKHVSTKDDENREDDKDDASSDDDDDDGKYDDFNASDDTSRLHGILSIKTNLNITIKNKPIAIHENHDNADLLVTLRDQVTLAQNKLLPSVKRWLDAFTKANGHEADMKSALDFKMDIENMLKKAEKLHVTAATRSDKSTKEADSDDDDDFVEVPEKEGYEPYIPAFLREEYGLNPLRPSATAKPSTTTASRRVVRRKENDNFSAEDPTSWAATLKKMKAESSTAKSLAREDLEQKSDEPQPSTSKEDPSSRKNREELLRKAPIIPYGNDLYHWGGDIEAPLMVRNDSEAKRWWTSQEHDDKIDDMALAAIKRRTINFVGKFKPVKWHCRAPLPTGNLCTRMDRVKCPFHGKIVPRDEHGVPNGPDRAEAKAEEVDIFEQKSNGWDDPELHAEIFAATGIDLSLKKTRKGKGKNRERRFPELTDLKTLENTTRRRLEEKLFSKATVKRVAQSLDELDAKRHREKFGNNFNYSCQL